MAFKFKFDRILQIRRHKEEVKMNEFAKEQRKLQALIDSLNDILREGKKTLDELREKEKDSIKVNELIQYRIYLSRLKLEEGNIRKSIKDQETITEEKRQELVEASKERRIMEKLKEKNEGEYWKEYWKTDEKENDELTTTRVSWAEGE